MAEKDLNEKMEKEPIFKVIKKDGSLKAELVAKPVNEDEDTLLDMLIDGLDEVDKSGLTGFGKQSAPKDDASIQRRANQNGLSGIGEWMASNPNFDPLPDFDDDYIPEPDPVIDIQVGHIMNKQPDSNKILNTINYVIQSLPEQFSGEWWKDDTKVIALAEVVSEEMNVNEAQVALTIRRFFG